MKESFVLENGLQSPLSTSPTNLLSPLSGSPTDSAIESLVCQRPRPLVVSLAYLLNLAKKCIVFRFCNSIQSISDYCTGAGGGVFIP